MGHNNTKGNRKFIKGRYTANAAKGRVGSLAAAACHGLELPL